MDKILVTGNNGYIGPILVDILLEKGYDVVGIDTNYYGYHTDIYQLHKDIRDIKKDNLKGIHAIIHLAALSNDPLGELNPELTYDINLKATIRLANIAKKMGVERFIYSSSQSMYGIADTSKDIKEDEIKNPITTYAKTKWDAECELKKLDDGDFIVVCFRPSTVFGVSPNLRCDIVFNNLLASSYTTGKIEIKSDGSPIRPVIHIQDISNAFIAGLEAPEYLISRESFNVGYKNGNYTIKEMANIVQSIINDSSITFTGEHPDSRTYKVSFDKILTRLKDYYKPEWNLVRGGMELKNYFDKIKFIEKMFKSRTHNRISQLKYLIDKCKLNGELYWN